MHIKIHTRIFVYSFSHSLSPHSPHAMYELPWHIPKKGRKYEKSELKLERRRIEETQAATARQSSNGTARLSPQLPRLVNNPPFVPFPLLLQYPLSLFAFPGAMSILEPGEWQHFSSGYVQTEIPNAHTLHTDPWARIIHTLTHMQSTHTHIQRHTHRQTCHTHSLALIGACVGNSRARLAVGQELPPLPSPSSAPSSSMYLPHYIDTISQPAECVEGMGVRGCCLRTHQADENGNVKLTLLAGSAQHDREAAHKASSDVRHYPEVG